MPIQRQSTVRQRTSLFEDAVAIVASEYATELSLDDIARRVASSRRQLQRAYAEIGETTFRDHLTKVRMERAAELLGARGLTVRLWRDLAGIVRCLEVRRGRNPIPDAGLLTERFGGTTAPKN